MCQNVFLYSKTFLIMKINLAGAVASAAAAEATAAAASAESCPGWLNFGKGERK